MCRDLNDLLPSPQTFVYILLFELVGEVKSDLNSIMFFSSSLSLAHSPSDKWEICLSYTFFCMCFKTCLTSHSPTLSQRCTLICSFWFSFPLIVWYVINSFVWLMFYQSIQLFFSFHLHLSVISNIFFSNQIFDFYALHLYFFIETYSCDDNSLENFS